MNQFRVLDLPADHVEGDVVAALFFADQRPVLGPAALLDWRLGDPLTQGLVAGACSGRPGENLLVRNNGKLGSDWVLFAGGGQRRGLDAAGLRGLLEQLLRVLHQAGFQRLGLCLAPLEEMTADGCEALVRQALENSGVDGCDCLLSLEPV